MADISLSNSSINGVGDNDTSPNSISKLFLSTTARFWIMLSFEIPSIFCSLLLLYYLCFDRTLRQALNNHVIILLLIVILFSQVVDITNVLTFMRLDYSWPQTHLNCYVWWFVSSYVFSTIGILTAWGSFERHILIFHSQLLNTKKKRILIHYLPLATIIVYSGIFYSVCIFFVPCEPVFNYYQAWCSAPCYYTLKILFSFDSVINGLLPCLIIIIFNVLLFIRVIKQKQRLRQQIQWIKYRRMIIQLVSCSALFLLLECPYVGFSLAHLFFGIPPGPTGYFELFIYFSNYFIVLWMPFVCLGSLPEVWSKIKRIIRVQYGRRRVVPHTLQPNP